MTAEEFTQEKRHKVIRKIIWTAIFTLLMCLPLYYLILLYVHYYVPEGLPPYTVKTLQSDDTLSIVIIGDSWAERHAEMCGDTIFDSYARRIYGKPLKCRTRGKGFATSKDVYFYMFNRQMAAHSYEPERCTQPLIETHPNYCVIYAGINDAIMQRPSYYYTGSIESIIRLLLHNNIRPVVMEMPLFSYDGAVRWRTKKERLFLSVRSFLMGTWSNDVAFYRHSLMKMLSETGLKDSILYIPTDKWNPNGWKETNIYGEDGVHLNIRGYHKLDSCITYEVTKDFMTHVK